MNGAVSFWAAFGTGFLLWTIVNLWDVIVLDILWFCHDPRFVFKGTEDMTQDYHDYCVLRFVVLEFNDENMREVLDVAFQIIIIKLINCGTTL